MGPDSGFLVQATMDIPSSATNSTCDLPWVLKCSPKCFCAVERVVEWLLLQCKWEKVVLEIQVEFSDCFYNASERKWSSRYKLSLLREVLVSFVSIIYCLINLLLSSHQLGLFDHFHSFFLCNGASRNPPKLDTWWASSYREQGKFDSNFIFHWCSFFVCVFGGWTPFFHFLCKYVWQTYELALLF